MIITKKIYQVRYLLIFILSIGSLISLRVNNSEETFPRALGNIVCKDYVYVTLILNNKATSFVKNNRKRGTDYFIISVYTIKRRVYLCKPEVAAYQNVLCSLYDTQSNVYLIQSPFLYNKKVIRILSKDLRDVQRIFKPD